MDTLSSLRDLYETEPDKAKEIIRSLGEEDQIKIASHWSFRLRYDQIWQDPETWGKYGIKVYIPGRGWGKTHCLSRNCINYLTAEKPLKIAVICKRSSDIHDIWLRGKAGLVQALVEAGYKESSTASQLGPTDFFVRRSTDGGSIEIGTGSMVRFYTAGSGAESLRGKEFHLVLLDEILTWFEHEQGRDDKILEWWEQILTVTRIKGRIGVVVASTPTPCKLLKLYMELEKEGKITMIRGSTYDNPHLDETYIDSLEAAFGSERRRKQELLGVVSWDIPGALWTWDMIHYVDKLPENMMRTVVAVDPAVTNNPDSDETGIIVAAKDSDGILYVLADETVKASTAEWAKKVITTYHKHEADCIVYESNQGGDLVRDALRTVDRTAPLKSVRASKGKYSRAEPIAALYEQGKVYHLDKLTKLEEQMVGYSPEHSRRSPDRLDALVWALHELSPRQKYEVVFG